MQKDPQSVDHVVQLCSFKTTDLLEDEVEKGQVSAIVCQYWLKLIRRYLKVSSVPLRCCVDIPFLHCFCWQVFFSRTMSLLKRVSLAGRIITFLWGFRTHVQDTPGLTLEGNFLSNQTFQHTLLSLHCMVLHIAYHAKFFPHQEVQLHHVGSDCCEDLFRFMNLSSVYCFIDFAQLLCCCQ